MARDYQNIIYFRMRSSSFVGSRRENVVFRLSLLYFFQNPKIPRVRFGRFGHRQRRRAGEERHYEYLSPVCIRDNKITFGNRAGLEVRKIAY